VNDEVEPGTLTVTVKGKKGEPPTVYRLWVDRIAAARDGQLYLLSVAGAQGEIKGLRAALGGGVAADFGLDNVHVACSDPNTDGERRLAQRVRPDEVHKYDVVAAPLGFGVTHAVFTSRAPGFLRSLSDEAVWRELKRPEFTTPLLRSWAGPVAAELRRLGLLTPLYCHGCACAVISAQTGDLDKIVEEGVRRGTLPFRESA
jgi:hypothetical protein